MLRLVQCTAGVHKLSAPWEEPFVVSKALHNNAYYLIDAQEAMKDRADIRRGDEETLECSFASSFLLLKRHNVCIPVSI